MLRKLVGFLPSCGQHSQAGAIAIGLWLAFAPSAQRAQRGSALAADASEAWEPTDAPALATLERAERPSGGDILRGEAHFALQGGLRSVSVRESAEVDVTGRLVLAEVYLSYAARGAEKLPKHLVERVTFDGAGHSVRVVLVDGEVQSRHVAGDFPWVYQPFSLPSGKAFSTPVAVSVARSAARVGQFVQRVSALGTDSSVSCDQLAVSGSNEDWIVLGDDLATFSRDEQGRGELTTLRVAALGLELRSRVAPLTPLG